MSRVCAIAILILILLLVSAPARAEVLFFNTLKCPICGAYDNYGVVPRLGEWAYSSDSRFHYIFHPYTDECILYACQICHFTCFEWDFEKVPAMKIADIRKALEKTYLSPPDENRVKETKHWRYVMTYHFIPMTDRLAIAEKIYNILGQTDEEWCRFYRMKAYHFEHAGMHEEANEARKKALEIAGKMIAERKNTGIMKELYLISGAMKCYLRDYEGARRDFDKGKDAQYRDSRLGKEESEQKEGHLNDLLQEFLAARDGEIELILAAKSGRVSIAEEILEKSPDLISVKDHDGYSLLDLAAWGRRGNMARFLVAKGIEVNSKNRNITPLHRAARNGSLEITELLISNGADVNAKGEDGKTPLFNAVILRPPYDSAQKSILNLLAEHGADLTVRDDDGRTPLHHAADYNSTCGADFLISRGVDINARDKHCLTPLHMASRNGYIKMANLLLSKGAEINATDNIGWTPLSYAIRYGDASSKVKISEFLISSGARKTDTCLEAEIIVAAQNCETEKCRKLLDRNPRLVNAKDYEKRTPLHEALKERHWITASLLISRGADVNAGDENGKTPLYEAIYSRRIKMVELLIQSGADVNARSYGGKTPLQQATDYIGDQDERKAFLDLLLRYGAKE